MWYRLSKNENFEDKILRIDAENYVRNRFLCAGKSISSIEVANHVSRLIKNIIDKYGSIHNVRLSMPDESLMPAIRLVGKNDDKLP